MGAMARAIAVAAPVARPALITMRPTRVATTARHAMRPAEIAVLTTARAVLMAAMGIRLAPPIVATRLAIVEASAATGRRLAPPIVAT